MKILKILLFAVLFAVNFSAQTPTPTPAVNTDDDEVIRVESRLIAVPISVLDTTGQPVLTLKKEDFSVFEEGESQEIDQLNTAESVPLEIALLFDVSGSVDPMFKFEQEMAAGFLRGVMKPEDRATIFTIGENPQIFHPRDVSTVSADKISSIQPNKGFTAFYDTVSLAAKYLEKNAPEKSRKVIIAITDGEDTNSEGVKKAFADAYKSLGKKLNTLTAKELREVLVKTRNDARGKEQNKVLRNLQNTDAVFYAVNPAGNSFHLNTMSKFGQENLQKFSDETGGTAFLPKKVEDLQPIFRQLTNELRSQYLLQYYSSGNYPPNKYVKLKVNLKNPAKLRLRARQGYFVKPE